MTNTEKPFKASECAIVAPKNPAPTMRKSFFMKIVTSANKKFEPYLNVLQSQCDKLGYTLQVFDLGGLGYGEPATVTDENFQNHGWYHEMHGDWKTRALHKPSIIAEALDQEPVAYLDADAFPVAKFDEIWEYDFDIGVTERCADETDTKILGPINAGVLFFKPTAKAAVAAWQRLTEQTGNDQRAMCLLLQNPEFNFKRFPAKIYNYYRFPAQPDESTKIYHFKGAPEVRACFDGVIESLK